MCSDSKLVVNYLNRIWRVREPSLAQIVEQIRMEIRRGRLKVAFKWVPRDENRVADAVGRAAREANARVEWRGDATADLVARFFKSSSVVRSGSVDSTVNAAGEGTKRSVDGDSSLALVPVRVKRLRGRPRKRDARRARPPADVVSATCHCLRCDKEV